MEDLIIVSNWDEVDANDFYLSKEWEKTEGKESVKKARELQKESNLFEAFILPAKAYALYKLSDADKVLINRDGDTILHCEGAVIECENHVYREEYNA